MAELPMRQRLVDSAAIAASLGCLIHCLALPVLFVLVPATAAFIAVPESFHLWALAFAVPTSFLAMMTGFVRHHSVTPGTFAIVGLALIASGIGLAPDLMTETALTVAGALCLMIGHTLNWREAARPRRALSA